MGQHLGKSQRAPDREMRERAEMKKGEIGERNVGGQVFLNVSPAYPLVFLSLSLSLEIQLQLVRPSCSSHSTVVSSP